MKLNITQKAIINGKYTFKLAWKRASKYKAIPKYARAPNFRQKILAIYIKAQTMNLRSKKKFQVDHIIPLYHPLVCGLHVPLNLQVISKLKNQNKSNIFTPHRELNGKKYLYEYVITLPKPKLAFKKSPQKLAKKRLRSRPKNKKCFTRG